MNTAPAEPVTPPVDWVGLIQPASLREVRDNNPTTEEAR